MKVLNLRKKILAGEELSQEELDSPECKLAEYKCPHPYGVPCYKCKYREYCDCEIWD